MDNYNPDIQGARYIARSREQPEQLELPVAGERRDAASGEVWTDHRQRVNGVESEQPRTENAVTNEALAVGDARLGQLYAAPLPARRSGPLYNAFSYPTKIDPEAIAIFVAAHTKPGDTVLDVFAGSGTTGLAARLCERPTDAMKRQVSELDLPVEWGPRSVVLYELSVIGALLAGTMCDPPDPSDFERAAREMVTGAVDRFGWLYAAEDPSGGGGLLRHTIWTDVLVCPTCHTEASFWELAVSRSPLEIKRRASCAACGTEVDASSAERATATGVDPVIGRAVTQRVRHPAYVYGRTGRRTWQRPPVAGDLDLVERVNATPIPSVVPTTSLSWGDLYRSGYHQGIENVHHFYTRRNLIALGALCDEVEKQPSHLRDALRLLVLSYNAVHSTLMTRVVVKNGMSDFVLTGAQSGVLYVSSLPVEKNVFAGVARKTSTFCKAFEAATGGSGEARVVNASSTSLDLPDRSVDYVFTDPPFGGFIPYSEINQINEAWLGSLTDPAEEAIVSPAQGKDVSGYGALMKRVFAEVSRVMKDDALATVVFHSSKPDVWKALGEAFTSADLVVQRTSVLDRTQVSFKQVVSEGSTRGDAIFLLSRGAQRSPSTGAAGLHAIISELRNEYGGDVTPQHLYSRYVARCLEDGRQVELTSNAFYAALRSMEAAAT